MFTFIKRGFPCTNHKDMGIFYSFNFPFILSVDHWSSFSVVLGGVTVLGTYLLWYYMKNSKVIAITTIYYNFIRFIRVYTVKSLRQLRSQSIYNFIFVFYLLLSFFFIIVLQDLDKSLLDIWHLRLIFNGVDQESKVSLLFFKTFFYSFVFLSLLLPFILSFVLFLYTASFTALQKRMTVIFMFCYSLLFYILGIPTLRQLIMKSSNFVFFQNGVFSNTLFECCLFKLTSIFYRDTQANQAEVVKNFVSPLTDYFLKVPNYNVRYVFDFARTNMDPTFCNMVECLKNDDMVGANQALEELLNWQGPWNIQDYLDASRKNGLANMLTTQDFQGVLNLNQFACYLYDTNVKLLNYGPLFAEHYESYLHAAETQTFFAVSQDSCLMILGGVLLLLFFLLPPGSGKGDIAPGGLALARKFQQKGKTDFLDG